MKKRHLILFVLVCLLAACSTTGYFQQRGGLKPDSMVDKAFAEGAVDPNMKYFYLNSPSIPYVIIGVDRNLTLANADDWRTMGPQADLRDLAQAMYDRSRMQGYEVKGFRMSDQNNRSVGIWYSIWETNIINAVIYSKDQTPYHNLSAHDPEAGAHFRMNQVSHSLFARCPLDLSILKRAKTPIRHLISVSWAASGRILKSNHLNCIIK